MAGRRRRLDRSGRRLERFVSAQNKYSLLDRDVEDELVPACERVGVGILPFFPLEFGLLTGKYKRGQDAPEGTRLAQETSRLEAAEWDRIEAVEAFAAQRGVSMLQVAMGGLAAQPAVASVIAGVTRAEQVVANAQAGLWEPTAMTSRRWKRPRAWTDAGPCRSGDRFRSGAQRVLSLLPHHGAVAQLVAHLVRNEGVRGSSPLSST